MNPSPIVLPADWTPVVDSSTSSTGSAFFDTIATVFPLLFVGALVFIVFTAVRNYQAARRGGVDPFAVDTELKVRAINSGLLRGSESDGAGAEPVRSVEARLAELDDLADRGVISAEERTAARLRVLGDN